MWSISTSCALFLYICAFNTHPTRPCTPRTQGSATMSKVLGPRFFRPPCCFNAQLRPQDTDLMIRSHFLHPSGRCIFSRRFPDIDHACRTRHRIRCREFQFVRPCATGLIEPQRRQRALPTTRLIRPHHATTSTCLWKTSFPQYAATSSM